MFGEQCSYKKGVGGMIDDIPFIFQNCSQYFVDGDEIYATCDIDKETDPCYLLKELHRSDTFSTYFLAIIPMVLSIITFIINLGYLIAQIKCFRYETMGFKKREAFLMSRSSSNIFAIVLFYVILIVWKVNGFNYVSAMIFIIIGGSTFMSITGIYIVLTVILYMAVAHHISYMTTITLTHCWLIIGLIWIISTVTSVFVGMWGATLFYPDSAPFTCSFESCQQPLAIVIVIMLSICYGTVIGLYIAMMARIHQLVRKSSMVQARCNSNSMIAMRRLSMNMITFAIGTIPILIVCIVALVNLKELSSLGEGCKSPCKTFRLSYLLIDVEMMASISAIVWLIAMIADPVINILSDKKLRGVFIKQFSKFPSIFRKSKERTTSITEVSEDHSEVEKL
ncbi:G-protein coupled receptors family 1 profile domain-containing protein [Caenorhabditis elegans]|uniref:G-protein coupled receptors family 1 profile domain-containing protein n=1 Tax=Caenorhabditis elegans TaxID=6239 RepID=Q23484_CAEEL|nr:G-protein coupled receptors family 1 profile domain-containing protein [Caenorhabditis elegans]CCD61626.2 G-protein coupled receptors family 1 profile domain-containing protein [Caenorhabditis elegans]|eukprot:NP_498545.2 Uncharacterized protein CELE_ZK418.6 [Caenorhabditis elegans]